ncbi:NAD+ diphosphatase [Cryobacterium mesophilum]|uniref:NAD(+) diphosphatase n=1 Tax=Terrimesophilobacter mesophilus TaxID=433647 RepID=UPI00179205DE|nr:NAD(+) diphosphatase [Terrimesophilobacter mesophilus]MBB5633868.1 NAD+ diphosphatase [Terrimesophilobacter mesophilus]
MTESRAHPAAPAAGLATALSRSAVDRDYLSRLRPNLFEELRADPGTRLLPVWSGKALCDLDGAASLVLFAPDRISASGAVAQFYLGRSTSPAGREPKGTAFIAVSLDDEAALTLADEDAWVGMRDVAALLDDRDAGLLVEAIALANWRASHRFSPRTGGPLVLEDGGWVLRAPGDSAEVFPRTDPAIIVAVVDEQDRLLLGSNAMWQHDRYSLLAGFVEPGESLEAAVIREIFEESGIRVVDPTYLGSQPWPFPASLMLGFRALADPSQDWTLAPDGTEILDVRWFTREELRSDEGLILPGPASIARAIIDQWLGAG